MKKKVKIMNKNQRIVKLTLKIIKKHQRKLNESEETQKTFIKLFK